MKRVRRQTSALIEELSSLRKTRKSIDEFVFNFLKNFTEYSEFMHLHLENKNFENRIIEIAFRQYIVFLVSCWETYFRDLFVYVSSSDMCFVRSLLDKFGLLQESIDTKHISLPELLSRSINFQNIDGLEFAYDNLWGAGFLEYVCTTKIDVFGCNGKVFNDFSIVSLFPDWRLLIDALFDIRHNVVHDANFRPDYNVEFIQKVEALFLVVPQIASHFVALRFGSKRFILKNDEISIPYLFSMSDILSDDWEPVENDQDNAGGIYVGYTDS